MARLPRRQIIKQLTKIIKMTNGTALGAIHHSMLECVPARYRELFLARGTLVRFTDYYALDERNLLFLKDLAEHPNDHTLTPKRIELLRGRIMHRLFRDKRALILGSIPLFRSKAQQSPSQNEASLESSNASGATSGSSPDDHSQNQQLEIPFP